MITVERISAAAEIIIMSVRSQHIVNVIVKAFERKARTEFISLSSVVEDDIEDHFYAIVMEIFDQIGRASCRERV